MSITDELREAAAELEVRYTHNDHDFTDLFYPHPSRREFLAIADRIDAEHEAACAEAYGNGVMSVPIALDESQWVKLPVDADGVPFRIGDKVDSDHYEDGTVIGIQYGLAANGAIRELVAVRPHGWDTATWHDPEEYAHHHAPTVEDVLREFGKGWHEQMSGPETFDIADYVERYAAKLRLAGDAE